MRTPLFSSASTSTNKPATSGSTDQEMSFIVFHGPSRLMTSTMATVSRAGDETSEGPSWRSKADDTMSAMPVTTMPAAATLPDVESVLTATSVSIGSRRLARCDQRSTRKVTTMEAMEAMPKPHQPLSRAAACGWREDDEVRRVGDRQHEARGIGDEGADEEIGQRLGLGRLGGGVDGRRQHDGGGIVREETS